MNNAPLDELDERLKQLAIVAQQYPPLTLERQLALTELVREILRSGRLWHPTKGQFNEDTYNEARQNLLLYICQEIEKYNIERGTVMAWVNMLMHRRFFKEAVSQVRENYAKQIPTLSDLDNFALTEETPSLLEKIMDCIEVDPENIFKNECIGKQLEANFQVLMKRRISGDSWENISADVRIKVSTLSSFYQRFIKRFSPKFKEYFHQ